ncbi:MAG: hypothetical protein KDA79_11250 [Planctomycetaceae bacterium]|nr:hypothetical protein [Planctomycetaceae bacterium]
MNSLFPFGLDQTTIFYLVLYVLTLVIHWALMAYVLAGSLWLAWATVFPGSGSVPRGRQPLSLRLRDWMPFMLGGAITAGVAPLLFVQILYRHQFYTANLLLGWRWMLVIPVLILAFYLLYLLKSPLLKQRPQWLNRLASAVAAVCFVFVAFCWTANHLLSLNESHWPVAYVGGPLVAARLTLIARLATWLAGTVPAMCVLAGWQLFKWPPPADQESSVRPADRLALLSCGGIVLAAGSAFWYFQQLPAPVQQHLTGSAGAGWLGLLIAGAGLQLAGWLLQWRQHRLHATGLSLVTAGSFGSLLGIALLREIVRYSQIDLTLSREVLEVAARTGGFGVFLIFAVLNGLLIFYCVRLVTSRDRQPQDSSSHQPPVTDHR